MSEQPKSPADTYVIPDFLADFVTDPLQRLTVYLIIFGAIAILQAGLLKRKLLVESPRNRFNWVFYIVISIAIWRMRFFLDRQPSLMIFAIGFYVIIEYMTHKVIPTNFYILHVYDLLNVNVIRDEYVMYKHGAVLCIALQDLWSTIKRIFFNRHVYVRTNSGTNFTENYDTPLFLCNSYTIKEEKLVEEQPRTGFRAKIFGIFQKKQIVMELDVCQAHEYNRYEFVRKVAVLDYVVEKYEKVMLAYVKIRTMLTSMVARKQSRVLLNALKVFEDAITITQEERQMLQATIKKTEDETAKVGVDEVVETPT